MPKLPAIPGVDLFNGKMFHSSRWDYSYTGGDPTHHRPVLDKLDGKRVAIIGTGATAIQAVPHLAAYAQQLYVVQRTPASIDERKNTPPDRGWLDSLEPGWQEERIENFHRMTMEAPKPDEADLICDIWTEINRNLADALSAEGWPEISPEEIAARQEIIDYQVMERLRRRVDATVKDPSTAEALKPFYRLLCKRPLSSNDYYPAFNQPNVQLIDVSATKGVESINEKGFVANGAEYEVDCLIFASGFEVTSDLQRRWGIDVVSGRGGLSIYDHWRDGPRTFHGVMTNDFPNQFYVGYVQGGLNATYTEQLRRQGEHIAYVIKETLHRGCSIVEPTLQAQEDYVRHFSEVEIDISDFQRECTPSYFNNEGQVKAPWSLYRNYGLGWGAFMTLMEDWRHQGRMEGLNLDK